METRPNPDALLARVQADEAKLRRGKLKLFFGAAPGVGKTYAMLEAARKVAKEGQDVVIGYVEPHARPETQALVLGLDILPKRRVIYRGRELLDFSLAEALARKPQIIVVDELAHTNAIAEDADSAASGLVHAKRWQDVEALLAAGIDVYSTVNVQHLESLNDIVAKITGVVVRETLPDAVFEQADEVELVDFPPDDLIGRLREGKVYVPGQAARALEHFFNKGNLIALRELALRKMAERVDRQMTDYRTERAIDATWPAAERLLVCVTPGPTSASLVRAARRMATGLRSPWLAVHIETPRDARLTATDRQRLAETLHLARRLGAEVVTLGGADPAAEILAYARRRNVTKIVVGKTLQPRWRELLRGSFVNELARHSGDIDVYVIRGELTPRPPPAPEPAPPQHHSGYAAAVLAVVICTGVCWLLFGLFSRASEVTLCMVYLAGVVAIATRFGRGPSIVASLLGMLAFDFFFVKPYWTFAVSDGQYLFTFAVMLVTGLLISTLTNRLAFAAQWSRQREQASAALGELSRGLVEIDELTQFARVHGSLEHVADGEVHLLVADPAGLREVELSPARLSDHERAVAQWVAQHKQAAGLGTDTLPSVGLLFVPLAAGELICGVLGVRPRQRLSHFPPEHLRLIEAAAGQLALAVERIRAAEVARQAQLRYEREQLRSALLSAVSHDFRTPLAAIAGAGSTLAEAGQTLPHETRQELAESIVAETDRLNRLVSNLLDMTRLEAGSLQLDRQWQPPGELVGAVVRRMSRLLEGRRLAIDVPADLPLAYLDELLFHQVLVNLLENAVRYTPPEAAIAISAGMKNDTVWFEVADTGPGLRPGDEERVFEKFYRGQQRSAGGAGLGLAICRGIVELHGGTIRAANRSGGGAVFRIELPQPAITIPAEPAAA